MRLYHTPTSPFVRKVMVVAHELGLAPKIETVFLRPTPLKADETLSKDNPLSKIPALVLDDGTSLYDSAVICEYLDSLHTGAKMIPPSGMERWHALRRQALCDGILEAGVIAFYERSMRPKELQWDSWIDGQTQKALQGLDALEREAAKFDDGVDIGRVCAAAMLGWLEFRKPFGDLRPNRPKLFAWYDRFAQRASMVATTPHA